MLLSPSWILADSVIKDFTNVDDFNSITLNGVGQVILEQGEKHSVSVETDTASMEFVRVLTDKKHLSLNYITHGPQADYSVPDSLIYHVSVVALEGIRLRGSGILLADNIDSDALSLQIDGSGKVTIQGVAANSLDVSVNGSGRISLSGVSKQQQVAINGSGVYRSNNLLSESAEITVSGSGRVFVNVSDTLNADIKGSGRVEFSGNPQTRNSAVSGSGGFYRVD